MRHKSTWIKIIVLILIIGVIGCAANNLLQKHYFYPLKYTEEVNKNAEIYGMDPMLIMAVIKAESNFAQDAISNKSATGLMQITPETAQWCAQKMGMSGYNQEVLTNPEVNIAIGTWYIDYLTEHYNGNINLALAAYNAGAGNVDKWVADGHAIQQGDEISLPYKETTEYVNRINNYYNRYKQLYN